MAPLCRIPMPVAAVTPTLRRVRRSLPFFALATLVACGGGSGGTAPVGGGGGGGGGTTPQPQIGVNPTTLTFAAQAGLAPTTNTTQIAITNAGTGTLAGLAVGAVTYGQGQPTGWLTARLGADAAPTAISVVADWSALTAGTYTATIPVTSTASGVTAVAIPVTLTLTAPPSISLVPDNVGFTAVVGGANPATQSIQLRNGGGGALAGLAFGPVEYTSGPVAGWLVPTIGGTTAPASAAFDAITASLPVGIYTARVPVTSTATGVTNSPQFVNVGLTITFPPSAIAVRPSSTVTFNAPQGATTAAAQQLFVEQANGSPTVIGGLATTPISYGAGATGWLVVERPLGATSPDSLRLGVQNIGALAVGEYRATFDITGTGVAARTVTVVLAIGPGTPPRIVPILPAGADTLVFQMNRGGTLPAPQPVSITNGGTQPLTGLDFQVQPGIVWLAPQLAPSGNGAALDVILNANARNLSAGRYVTFIDVRSTATSVASVRIPIVLRVN